jgi:hypothetical protein
METLFSMKNPDFRERCVCNVCVCVCVQSKQDAIPSSHCLLEYELLLLMGASPRPGLVSAMRDGASKAKLRRVVITVRDEGATHVCVCVCMSGFGGKMML